MKCNELTSQIYIIHDYDWIIYKIQASLKRVVGYHYDQFQCPNKSLFSSSVIMHGDTF